MQRNLAADKDFSLNDLTGKMGRHLLNKLYLPN